MKKIYNILFGLHLFVGIGGLVGGFAAIINPQNPLGISIDVLKNSPFNNYLIPGIILFIIIGLGNLISAFMFSFKLRYQGYISSVFSWALVIWIIVQCFMLNGVVFLHILFFIIGLIEALLSMLIIFEKRQFPANIIFNFYKKMVVNKK